jgi:hypothetical protein
MDLLPAWRTINLHAAGPTYVRTEKEVSTYILSDLLAQLRVALRRVVDIHTGYQLNKAKDLLGRSNLVRFECITIHLYRSYIALLAQWGRNGSRSHLLAPIYYSSPLLGLALLASSTAAHPCYI